MNSKMLASSKILSSSKNTYRGREERNMKLEEALKMIEPVNEEVMEECKKRWDSIAHPLHSLGKLEDLLVQITGITGCLDIHLEKKALVPMCADNGVVEEGVTQTGQEITALVAENFLQTKAVSSIMCKTVGAEIFPVDVGVAKDVSILNRKIAYGTKNMTKEPAMTREQAVQAIETGIEMVEMLKEKGYGIIATGEMGIGNTTTSSAVASVLLDMPVENMTGRGAGLSSEGLNRKINAIKKAVAVNKPDRKDAVDVVAKVGGFDIAAIAGLFLGGAALKIPVVIDGVISATGALVAAGICPTAKQYMIASHVSKEPAGHLLLEALGKEACLHCDMCLGEGTGAVAFFPLLDIATAVFYGMSDFGGIGMDAYVPLD